MKNWSGEEFYKRLNSIKTRYQSIHLSKKKILYSLTIEKREIVWFMINLLHKTISCQNCCTVWCDYVIYWPHV